MNVNSTFTASSRRKRFRKSIVNTSIVFKLIMILKTWTCNQHNSYVCIFQINNNDWTRRIENNVICIQECIATCLKIWLKFHNNLDYNYKIRNWLMINEEKEAKKRQIDTMFMMLIDGFQKKNLIGIVRNNFIAPTRVGVNIVKLSTILRVSISPCTQDWIVNKSKWSWSHLK